MGQLRQAIGLLVVVAAAVLVAFLAFGVVVLVIAIVSPLAGLVYGALKLSQARSLWSSRGKFQLPGSLQVIEPARARGFAISEAMKGAGGLFASLIPTFLVFRVEHLLIPDIALALGLLVAAGVIRRRLAAGAHPVEILPKE